MSTLSCVPVPGPSAPFGDSSYGQIRQLVLLAPTPDVFPAGFQKVAVNPVQHSALMGQMQRLRGAVYLADGAIRPSELDADGRQVMRSDSDSFHVLALNGDRRVVGCVRFLPHQADVEFTQLSVSRSPLAKDVAFGAALRQAVKDQLESARSRGFLYVEVGGWALDASIRHSTEAVRMALLNFSLGLALGGAVGICTATMRNHSADILRRIGGRPLSCGGHPIPKYFDSRYGCEIEVITFDSDLILPRHAARIEQLRCELDRTQVLCNQSNAASLRQLAFAVRREAVLEPASTAA